MLKESYALSSSGVGYSILDQGYNPLLRNGHLQSTIGVQSMIQDRGISLLFVKEITWLIARDDVVERGLRWGRQSTKLMVS